MKRIAIALVVAGMAALPAIAITGAEAAALIRSEPDDAVYVTPSTYNVAWHYYSDGELRNSTFTVSQENWEADIENALANMKSTVNTLARDSFEALAKIAALQEVDNYLNARIDVLTGSVREALSQLTTVKSDDGHGNTSQGDTEVDGTSIKIKGLDVPVDGISIDYSGSPASEEKPNPIGLFGFSVVKNEDSVIPHPKNGRLWWSGVNTLVDENTITANDASGSPFLYQFGLKGWSTPDEAPGKCVRTMNGLLHGDDSDGPHYVLTHCGGALHYTPIGDPLQDGSAVDGTSITTNQATGATAQGKASLYGWDLASTGAGFIPSKGNGSPATLSWKDPADMVDNSSLAITTTDGANVWEVKGAHTYAGNHGRHYFGTGDDSVLGWHELPNATTNSVEGDEVTISSTTGEGDKKILGLKGWPPATDGEPYAVSSVGGSLAFVPIPQLDGTNGVVTVVDNVSIASNETGKLEIKGFSAGFNPCSKTISELLTADTDDTHEHEFLARAGSGEKTLHYVAMGRVPHPDADQFLTDESTKRFVLKTQAEKILKGTSDNGIEWIDPPTSNEFDGVSIELNARGKVALKGIGGGNEGKILSQSGVGVEWIDMPATNAPDGVSIVYDGSGKLALPGLGTGVGKVLAQSDGGVEWITPADSMPPDDASVVTNDGVIALYGFDEAGPNTMPSKGENGVLSWSQYSSATNLILAGAGINITHNGNGAITISAQPLEEESSGVSSTVSLSVVTDIRYDSSSHKFQCKRRTIMFTGTLGEEGGWEDVFEAVSHQSEHDSDEGAER